MISYVEYPPHDFELYSNQEAQFDVLASSQPYLPTSTYLDPTFSAPFDAGSLQAFSDMPRSQADLRFHFDGIAQGVKPSYQHYSPAASPNSGSHSFDVQPPNLSTSSESGASVSSSAMGSPYHDAWSSMNGLGLAPGIVQGSSGFDYDDVVATDKFPGCVGESFEISSSTSVSSSVAFPCASSVPSSSSSVGSHRANRACLETPPSRSCSFGQSNPRSEESSQSSVFRSPTTPASAKFSSPLSMRRSPSGPGVYKTRRNSLLSNEIWPNDIPESNTDSSLSPANRRSPHFNQNSHSFIPPLESSCRFPSSFCISLSRSTLFHLLRFCRKLPKILY